MAIREKTSINLSQDEASLEKAALKDIIRKRWENELGSGRQQSREVKEQLDSHVLNIKSILNNYDYEIFCMPNIISNTKSMSRSEVREYLKHMEALAVGYTSVFGNDLATLLLIGITFKSRSVSSTSKYHSSLSSEINRRVEYYDKLLQKHSGLMARVNYKIKVNDSGFFKFLRKKKVIKLKAKASAGSARMKTIEKKKTQYSSIKAKMSK